VNVEDVFDVGVVAVGADAGGDGGGSAEEDERLVDEVRAEVESMPLAGFSASFQVFSRAVGRKRSKCDSKVTRRPTADSARSFLTVRKSPSQRRLWKGMTSRPCVLARAASSRARAGGGEGLVDDDVLAGLECAAGETKWVSFGCGDDDEGDGLVGEEVVEGAIDPDVREGFGSVVTLAAAGWRRV